jgi:methylmalonyl-CoA/ethylmalonyl-CoA epimerase
MRAVKNINHLGIAVRSINAQRQFYEGALGAVFEGVEEVPDQKVRVAFFRVGEVRLELLEPTDPASTVAAFLEKRGEGLHHIAFTVEGIEDRIAELKQSGLRMIDEVPRPGAHHTRIAFVHPKSTFGVLTELCEPVGGPGSVPATRGRRKPGAMTPVKAINHIGIAVRSIAARRAFYEGTLGAVFEGTEMLPGQQVRVGYFRVGDVRLELLEPVDPDSIVAKFLEKRGEGLHHIAFTVEGIEDRITELEQSGVQVINDAPLPGTRNQLMAYLYPKCTFGVFTELCEPVAALEPVGK